MTPSPSTAHLRRATRYEEWLESRGLRFGFAIEIAGKADRLEHGVRNDTPPVEIWHRMLPTVAVVELMRERFGPTVITSAFRTAAYNGAVAKSKASQHTENCALDFHCATGSPREWRDALAELRANGVFVGGVGLYAAFVHVDTRGTNADWVG
ncbi:MAG TPA: D-Ala-D-Ala carboxypeptidase family metallohydrolase [Gemmatimonadaceae bacterium]|nr:D-Ala-D-Ala carboxypeptidase family metallohydrolase [Gemmatimonadaceae bacterium]